MILVAFCTNTPELPQKFRRMVSGETYFDQNYGRVPIFQDMFQVSLHLWAKSHLSNRDTRLDEMTFESRF